MREEEEEFKELREASQKFEQRQMAEREIADAKPDQAIANNNNDDPITGKCYLNTPSHGDAVAERQAEIFPKTTIPTTGEPRQLAEGKEAHRNEEVRPGEKPEVRTPSGKRMDRYNEGKAHIREIKPDNARGEKAGQKQLQNYKNEMDKAKRRSHTTELTKYKKKH